MKLLSFLLLVCVLHVSAGGFTQITLKVKNSSLEKVFEHVTAQTGISFFYKQEWLQNARPVDINVKNVSLENFLQVSLKNQSLSYEIINETVVLKPLVPEIKSLAPRPVFIDEIPQNERTIRVENLAGEPLVGATVVVKKTSKVYQTNAQGEVRLQNVQQGDTIVISFIGYNTASLKLRAPSIAPFDQVTLIPTSNELDVAIVQGYGTTTRRLTTGNIAKVTAEEIEKQPVMNPLLALQGKVAGLNVTQTSGFASAPVKVELRGRNVIGVRPNESIPSDPLYIIDGVPLTILEIGGASNYERGSTGFLQSFGFTGPAGGQSPFFNLNASDIQSIEVLKDADATAIYGSRAANGVILVTTKKGQAGKTTFSVNVQQGISKVTRFWDMMNTQQYLSMRREALKNDGIEPSIEHGDYDLLLWDTTRFTDWQRELFGGTGKTTNLQSELSGGNAQSTFRIAAGYNKLTDIMTASGANQRASLSFNVNNRSLNQRFSVALTGTYTVTESDMVSFPSVAMLLPPNAPAIYNAENKLNYEGYAGLSSVGRTSYPFAGLKQPYTSNTNLLNSNLVVGYQLVKGWKVSVSAGYNMAQANQEQLILMASQDPLSNPLGSASWGFNSNKNWIIEPQTTFETLLGRGKLNVLAGFSTQENNTSGLLVTGSGYTSDDLIGTITNAPSQLSGQNSGKYRYAAAFGRISYNLQNKYIINLNGRRDGSSRFGESKQYGNFGSVGVAWIFSEEDLIRNNIGFLSFGKLRGSYGTTGTDAVGDYKYLTRWSSINTVPYGGTTVLLPTQHANPGFQWQTTKKLEGAIDLGFFNDRLTMSIVYYRNRCGNQLVQFPIPLMTGFNNVTANSPALVQNDGWEFTLASTIVSREDFKWSLNFNTNFNNNKLLDYPGLAQSPFASTLIIGHPLNIVQRFKYTGIDPQTGEHTVEDKNHDGQYNYAPGKENSDTYAYNITPEFLGGLGTNFSYKTVQLSLFFNINKQTGRNAYTTVSHPPGEFGNQPVEIFGNQWKKPGDVSTYAKFTTSLNSRANYGFSDALYTDASFIRLSNLSLSYGLPASLLRKTGLKSMSFFIHANNIFVVTKYQGIDPENQSFGGLPPTRTVTGGLNFNF